MPGFSVNQTKLDFPNCFPLFLFSWEPGKSYITWSFNLILPFIDSRRRFRSLPTLESWGITAPELCPRGRSMCQKLTKLCSATLSDVKNCCPYSLIHLLNTYNRMLFEISFVMLTWTIVFPFLLRIKIYMKRKMPISIFKQLHSAEVIRSLCCYLTRDSLTR